MDRLWVLGSGGWMPRDGRETACMLVELADTLILLDAGTGVANLAAHTDVLGRHERLNVILTHYHLDHTVGLMYLKRFCPDMRVDVFGPGAPHYPKGCAGLAADLLQQAFYSSGPHGFSRVVRYHDYTEGDFEVDGVRVSATMQQHSSPSFKLRLEDAIVLATDTSFDAASWADVQPAHLLLHECWQLKDEDPRHSSAEALARDLPHDRFHRRLWVHLNPGWDDNERALVDEVARACGCELAEDGLELRLD